MARFASLFLLFSLLVADVVTATEENGEPHVHIDYDMVMLPDRCPDGYVYVSGDCRRYTWLEEPVDPELQVVLSGAVGEGRSGTAHLGLASALALISTAIGFYISS
ncbi:uncharacterized protein LOC126354298 [Schistocerca gregaria]|uniref:uncharacterized protein LOC126354298 n=1 Tax=Schistocerca gregaria TaxID=7010 RepID=UPI00211EC3F8|nr:uncharacterized protein LOC126354298 [Schistocerca gregaria]XP_049859809.1 uncharacterized protein LOC126354298 [Schistocerca gregaria]